MSDIGDLIKKLRGKRSLREASKLIGISHSYLTMIEKGFDNRTKAPVSPSPEIIKKISEAYNHSYEDLMKTAGYIDESNNRGVYIDIDLSYEAIEQLKTYANFLKQLESEDKTTGNDDNSDKGGFYSENKERKGS